MFLQLHNIFHAFTKKERRTWIVAILILFIALFLTGINAFYHKTSVTPVAGGRYIEGMVGQPAFLNPLIAHTDIDRALNKLIYANVLDFVEKYEVSEDHKTWSLFLKPELTWSDGERITSDDILFTIEAIQDTETRSPFAQTWQGITIERLSEREIRFTLRSPYVFFLDNLKDLQIVPQHIFGTIPTANLRISDFNIEPVGAGPYVFDRFEKRKDGFITEYYFRANPDYTHGESLIKEFVIRFFSTYEEAISAFNKKEIESLGGIDYIHINELKISREISSIVMPRYYALFINQSAHEGLREKAVRSALVLATDRAQIINEVFQGHATPVLGPIHPNIKGYDGSIYGGEKFSPETAIELLEDAGWKLNEAGVRAKTIKGEEVLLEFSVIVPDIQFLRETMERINAQWEKIGIKLIPIIMDPGEVVRDAIRTRNYQLILFGNILKNNPDVFSFWHSSERFSPGLNLSLYEDKSVDLLLETIRKDFDEQSRAENISALQKKIYEDIPAIFLLSPHYLYAHPKTLGGFTPILLINPSDRFNEVYKWYLKTARVFN